MRESGKQSVEVAQSPELRLGMPPQEAEIVHGVEEEIHAASPHFHPALAG